MTHVFDVLNGKLHVLDIELIVCSISKLKLTIESLINIPSANQILIISGGDVLTDGQRPADQGCGSEENPIFLFGLPNLNSDEQLTTDNDCYINRVDKIDKKELHRIQNIRYSLEWLENCYYFVKNINDEISLLNKFAATSLYEQRMQYQGWMAVIANFEDFCSCFQSIMNKLDKIHCDYRDSDQSFIYGKELLHNISKLNEYSLVEQHSIIGFDSIFKWIDNHMKTVFNGCDLYAFVQQLIELISKTDLSEVDILLKESQLIMEMVEVCCDNKIIAGTEERFIELQRICDEMKTLAYNSSTHLLALHSSLKKIKSDSKLRFDKRFLSDVCQAHQTAFGTIVDMFYESLTLWNRLCFSKQDLIKIIHSRLRWLVKVENDIGRLDGEIRFYISRITNIINRIDLIKQIDMVPTLYPEIVQELSRRNKFIESYANIRLKFLPIFENFLNNERLYREKFTVKLGDHFLSNLINDLDASQMEECTFDIDFDDELNQYNSDSLKYLSSIEQCSSIGKPSTINACTDSVELDVLEEIMSKICATYEKSAPNQLFVYRQSSVPVYSGIQAGDLVCIKLDSMSTLQIITNTKIKYFLHKKCYNNLKITEDQKKTGYAFGRVIRIQCCSIKKEPNRFNLPINTKFFIVTCEKATDPTDMEDCI